MYKEKVIEFAEKVLEVFKKAGLTYREADSVMRAVDWTLKNKSLDGKIADTELLE